jgi:hypothetical protein
VADINYQWIFIFSFYSLPALVAAIECARRFGWLGFVVGFPVAFLGLFFLAAIAVHGLFILERIIRTGMPVYPICRNGKCKGARFAGLGLYEGGRGDYEPVQRGGECGYVRCRCGDVYQKRIAEKTVVHVLADGTAVPYMAWKPFWGWHRVGTIEAAGSSNGQTGNQRTLDT